MFLVVMKRTCVETSVWAFLMSGRIGTTGGWLLFRKQSKANKQQYNPLSYSSPLLRKTEDLQRTVVQPLRAAFLPVKKPNSSLLSHFPTHEKQMNVSLAMPHGQPFPAIGDPHQRGWVHRMRLREVVHLWSSVQRILTL